VSDAGRGGTGSAPGRPESSAVRASRTWLRTFGVALLLALVAVPFGQVVSRNLLGLPFVGSEELSRFLLIGVVFVGYPLVVADDGNIVMAELRRALPGRVDRTLGRLIHLAAALCAGLIAYATIVTSLRNLGNATPTLGIPFWIFLSAAGVAFAGASLAHLWRLRRDRAPVTHVVG
jgi:TRAP-type C4-dicarboxylate transport system permease small subunit